MALEQIVVLLMDLGPNLVSVLVLLVKLEILVPFQATFGALTLLISTLTWERSMVLDQTQEILISPFVYDVVAITSLTSLLFVDDLHYPTL